MCTCYKIYGYFNFNFFTYNLSSVVHSATLTSTVNINVTINITSFLWDTKKKCLNAIFRDISAFTVEDVILTYGDKILRTKNAL